MIRILGIEDCFEGITYCDYGSLPLVSKPHGVMFGKAMREAGVEGVEKCFFVGEFSLSTSACFRGKLLFWLLEAGNFQS